MEQDPQSTVSNKPNGEVLAAYVTLILDETGSMQDCKGAAIAGVNEYLKTLRQKPTAVRFTLTLFNSGKLDVRHRAVPVAQVPELTELTYQPAEMTPLYDAIGRTLTAAAHEVPPESKKLCVILTDGLENASREYTRDGIARTSWPSGPACLVARPWRSRSRLQRIPVAGPRGRSASRGSCPRS